MDEDFKFDDGFGNYISNEEFDKEEEKVKLENFDDVATAFLLQKIDRILTGRNYITVTDVSRNNPETTLACTITEKERIFLCFEKIKSFVDTTFDHLLLTKGLNYHELAHILFSEYGKRQLQRAYNEGVSREIKNNSKIFGQTVGKSTVSFEGFYYSCVNLLEDCRIENLFFAEFPKSRHYFSFCVSKILLKELNQDMKQDDVSEMLSQYTLFYGRKFLNHYTKFVKEKVIEKKLDVNLMIKAEQFVDAYIVEPVLSKRLDIAFDYMKLLLENNQQIQDAQQNGFESMFGDSTQTKEQQVADALERLLDILQNPEKMDEDFNGLEQFGDKQDGKKEDSQDGQGSGQGSGSGKPELTMEDLQNAISKAVGGNEELKEEINNDIRKITCGLYGGIGQGSTFSGEMFRPSSVEKSEAERLEKMLKLLKGDLKASTERFLKSGKFDMKSTMKASHNGTFNCFRKQELNRIDKAKLGVSLLIDSSSSINDSEFKVEIQSSWTIAKALEKTESKVEVLEFSDSHRVLKTFNSEGDWQRTFQGGTTVRNAMKDSIKHLVHLRKSESIKNLIMIVVSDGEFSDSPALVEKHIEDAHKEKIKVIWILAKNSQPRQDMEKMFDWFIKVPNINDLSSSLKSIIKEIEKEVIRKVK